MRKENQKKYNKKIQKIKKKKNIRTQFVIDEFWLYNDELYNDNYIKIINEIKMHNLTTVEQCRNDLRNYL